MAFFFASTSIPGFGEPGCKLSLVSPVLWADFVIHQDNYKVIVFGREYDGADGRLLAPACRDPRNPHRVSNFFGGTLDSRFLQA
jgi:hypothetical protein